MYDYYILRNKILFFSFLFSLILSAFFYFAGYRNEGASLFSGWIIGALNFLLLAKYLADFNDKAVPKKNSFLLKRSFFRFFLMGVFIYVLIQKPWFQIYIFLIGLFSIQIVILTLGSFFNIFSKKF